MGRLEGCAGLVELGSGPCCAEAVRPCAPVRQADAEEAEADGAGQPEGSAAAGEGLAGLSLDAGERAEPATAAPASEVEGRVGAEASSSGAGARAHVDGSAAGDASVWLLRAVHVAS